MDFFRRIPAGPADKNFVATSDPLENRSSANPEFPPDLSGYRDLALRGKLRVGDRHYSMSPQFMIVLKVQEKFVVISSHY
jgi:hypothetical protein